MATTAVPEVVARPIKPTPGRSMAALERRGIGAWLTTTDHKRIGILYIVSTFVFFVLGGLAALAVRIQLALPEAPPMQPELYNHIFTMHAPVTIFLFFLPFCSAGLP